MLSRLGRGPKLSKGDFMKMLNWITGFCLLACASVSAEHGNGGGVNGPDLKGDAVPLALDRKIDVSRVEAITRDCLEKTAKKMWKQVYGRDFGVKPNRSVKFEQNRSGFTISERHLRRPSQSYGTLGLNPFDINGGRLIIFRGNECGNVENPVCGQEPSFVGSTRLMRKDEFNFTFPYLAYETSVQDFQYDDFGDLISRRIIATNLRLINGTESDLTPEKLYNEETKVEAKLKLDFREHRDCLLSGLQE